MNRLVSEDGQLYACGNGLCSEGDIECTNCHYTNKAFLKLAAYENTRLEPEEIKDLKECVEGEEGTQGTVKDLIELMQYRKLESQGLLIKLPCKVGESYTGICQEIVPSKKGWTTKRWLDSGVVEKIEVIVRLTAEKAGHSHGRNADELGEFWFIGENQREEAEKTLKELEEI